MKPRVERCRSDHGYAPGWIVLHGPTGDAWCTHSTWGNAWACANARSRLSAHALRGRW